MKKTSKILALVLVLCMVLSMGAFAAERYYLQITLTGPKADGTTGTVTAKTNYVSLSAKVAVEMLATLAQKEPEIRSTFAGTGMLTNYEDMKANSAAWAEDLGFDPDAAVSTLVGNPATATKYGYTVTVTVGSDSFDDTPVQPEPQKPAYDMSHVDCQRGAECPVTQMGADANAWYHDGVHFCLANDLQAGIPGEPLPVFAATTRAELVQLLWNLAGRPTAEGDEPYTDVAADAWYAEAVRWAHVNGVVNGVTETTFCPDQTITREQLVTILWRYANDNGIETPEGSTAAYADADEISDYAVSAMNWAVGIGLINGVSETELAPQSYLVNAESQTIVYRYATLVLAA